MKIPRIADFEHAESQDYTMLRLIAGMITAFIMYLFFQNFPNELYFVKYAWPITSGVIVYVISGYGLEDHRFKKAKIDFKNSLSNHDHDFLKKLASSPEMSDAEKILIVEYLNESSPGWSLA